MSDRSSHLSDHLLTRIQKIVFNYAWGEYNVLILPPSFPYGGMENPIFTFATPSIISKVPQNALRPHLAIE